MISIVVVTLDEQWSVRRLIESAHEQTYRPIDLIFVDGGSKDDTIPIIESEIQRLDSETFRIHLFHEKDFGEQRSPGHARNIGISMACSDKLVFLDADMFLLEGDSLFKIAKKLDECDFTKVKVRILVDTKFEAELAASYPRLHHCGYRKRVLDQVRFNPNLGYGEDKDLWYRIRKHFGINMDEVCETTIARHLPHTRHEHLHQTIWYGMTIPLFVRNVVDQNQGEYFAEVCGWLTYLSYCILAPFLILISLYAWSRFRRRHSLSYMLWHLTAMRYVFSVSFLIGALRSHSMRFQTWMTIRCLAARALAISIPRARRDPMMSEAEKPGWPACTQHDLGGPGSLRLPTGTAMNNRRTW